MNEVSQIQNQLLEVFLFCNLNDFHQIIFLIVKGLIVETSVAREEVKKRPMLYVAKEQHVKNDAL